MTTTTLHATNVAVTATDSTNPSELVGGSGAWDDASDATSAMVYVDLDGSHAGNVDVATADLDAIDLPANHILTGNGITFTARWRQEHATPGDLVAAFQLRNASGVLAEGRSVVSSGFGDEESPIFSGPVSANFDPELTYAQQLAAWRAGLDDGPLTLLVCPAVDAGDPAPLSYGMRVYELSVDIEHVEATPPPANLIGEPVIVDIDDIAVVVDVDGATIPGAPTGPFDATESFDAVEGQTTDYLFGLAHTPLAGSLTVTWSNLPLPPSSWSLAGNVLTISDPDALAADGDAFRVHYRWGGA